MRVCISSILSSIRSAGAKSHSVRGVWSASGIHSCGNYGASLFILSLFCFFPSLFAFLEKNGERVKVDDSSHDMSGRTWPINIDGWFIGSSCLLPCRFMVAQVFLTYDVVAAAPDADDRAAGRAWNDGRIRPQNVFAWLPCLEWLLFFPFFFFKYFTIIIFLFWLSICFLPLAAFPFSP